MLDDGEVALRSSDSYLTFTTDDVVLSARHYSGHFPVLKKVIEDPDVEPVVLPRGPLTDSVKRLREVGGTYCGVRLEFSPGEVVLSSSNPKRGSGRDVFKVDGTHEGRIQFAGDYLAEHLQAGDGDDVHIYHVGEIDPVQLRFPSAPELRAVLMPQRIE